MSNKIQITEVTVDNKPKPGQFYVNNNNKLAPVYIVARAETKYILISLYDGNFFTKPSSNINDIFGDAQEDFQLIQKEITIIPSN